MKRFLLALFGTGVFVTVPALAQETPPAAPAAAQEEPADDTVKREEVVVVTASRVETTLINAPATISVITSEKIANSAAQNYGDLLRGVPGLNVIQMSARDINVTTRQSTNTLANTQLTLLDGRSIYLDFFGLVLWDYVPSNPDDIKQIEVVRGPASAVWGANALTGVVNIITKTPRETVGDDKGLTTVSLTGGFFDRDAGDTVGEGSGGTFGANASVSQAPSDKISYRISAGYFFSDALPRPIGRIPVIDDPRVPGSATVGGGTYPPFENQGTSQPKFDARLDQELGNGGRLTYSAGVAGTEGIVHSGIGPFDIQSGSFLGYGRVAYNKGGFKLAGFINLLDSEAPNLLTADLQGNPIQLNFNTNTYDFEAGHTVVVGGKHILTFGGNARYNDFEISIAPDADNRTELGAYFQDEIFFDKFRFVLGGRVDKFGNIDDPVFSPRLSAMFKPAPDHAFRLSYNKAFRAPSVINNFADFQFALLQFPLGAVCQAAPPLCAGNPGIATRTLPMGPTFLGNPNLVEESLTAYEVGYTGTFGGKTTVGLSYYINDTDNNINFVSSPAVIAVAGANGMVDPALYPPIYTSRNPPPGWPFPPFTVDLLRPTVFSQIPATVTYLNLGPVRNQGVEVSLDHSFTNEVSVSLNYSWQDEPEVLDADSDQIRYPPEEISLPPTNRFNAAVNLSTKRFIGSLSVNYSDQAFWSDVLTSAYNGFTDAYTLLNGSFGVRFANGKVTTSVKVNNILNDEIQQHNFGDILMRSVVGEVRFKF
jgi:outer membrane receptor protein involved in Fe transport